MKHTFSEQNKSSLEEKCKLKEKTHHHHNNNNTQTNNNNKAFQVAHINVNSISSVQHTVLIQTTPTFSSPFSKSVVCSSISKDYFKAVMDDPKLINYQILNTTPPPPHQKKKKKEEKKL